jgi:hypothetical protein
VTDRTLGLLSRSLPSKPQSGYVNTLEDAKPPPPRKSAPHTTNTFSSPTPNYGFDNTVANGNNNTTSSYMPADGQVTHQATSYPAATQYPSYPDAPSNTSAITYSPQNNYNSYPTSSDVEAPLLAAFAAQASQGQPNNWDRPNTHSQPAYSGSSAWQQWTTTMTGNLGPGLEPQEQLYSASALMQLGGRDLSHGDAAQTNTSLAELTASSAGLLDHSHLGQAGTGLHVQWPMNIFGG